MEENMEKKEKQAKEEDELLLAARAQLWTQVFSFAHSQTLRCAVELHIPDIIHAHAGPTTLSHLASRLPLPSSPDRLRRLMCFLSHLNIFKHSTIITRSGSDQIEEDAYELTPLSRLLVRGEEKNMVPMVTVGFNVLMVPWHHIIGSLEKSSDNAFKRVFGVEFYEYAEHDAELGVRLNEVMACDTRWTMPGVIEWKEVFEGVGSLVDVGGGTGTAARAIAEAFPAIKCTVFDHPHVVESAPECEGVARIGGDMFEFIPPADALFLKWILHNYGDEECLKILKRCKEALPEKGGKVLIVDTVMDGDDDGAGDEFTDARLALDLEMMLLFGGKERNEEEWRRLLQHAGFSKCRIMPIKSTIHSLIEASL